MKRRGKRILLILVTIFIVIQFVPVPKTNPPVTGEIVAPQPVMAIFRRACYDCHSNGTVWPWYSHVAPVSWLIYNDVTNGRKAMNFSAWQQMSPMKQAKRRSDIGDEVSKGDMPLPYYVPLHPPSKLTAADKAIIRAWSEGR
jgi:hypothetical protein